MKSIVIYIFLLLIAGGLFSYLLFVTIKTDQSKKQMFAAAEPTPASNFSSSVHNFSFSYPRPYQVIENSPEAFEVGTVSGQMVYKSVGIRVLTIPAESTVENFLVDQANEICRQNQQFYSVHCTGLNEISEFISDTGVSGFKFYLNAEVFNPENQDILARKRLGPLFALEITPGKYVLLYTIMSEHPDKNIRHLPYIIAETFRILP